MNKDEKFVKTIVKEFQRQLDKIFHNIDHGDEFTQLMSFDALLFLKDQLHYCFHNRKNHLSAASGLIELAARGHKPAQEWIDCKHPFYKESDGEDECCACECGESHDGVVSSLKDQFKKMDESFIAFMESIKPR